jgi:hypothetical protein
MVEKLAWSRLQALLHAGFLLSTFFIPEDGSNIFLRNVAWLSVDY